MARSKWPEVKKKFDDIEKWLKAGLAEYQICKNLSIGKTTWEKYKKSHPELRELLKKGRENQISEVENSLFNNATGYHYFEEVAQKVKTKVKTADGEIREEEHLETVTVRKYKPAETGAIAFFLKNKSKGLWADNPQAMDLKREEVELRKKESEFRMF